MNPARHLLLWMAAVFVMVAVSLTPSVASAHSGHAHGAATAAPAIEGGSLAGTAAEARIHEARLLCSGPCCLPACHACSSCCSAGLAPAAASSWDHPRPARSGLARDVRRPPGLAPETLPEPPRSFA